MEGQRGGGGESDKETRWPQPSPAAVVNPPPLAAPALALRRQESTSVAPEDVEAFSLSYARTGSKAAAAQPNTLFAKTTWDE